MPNLNTEKEVRVIVWNVSGEQIEKDANILSAIQKRKVDKMLIYCGRGEK